MRPHLFELGDLSWFPRLFRDLGTEWLQFHSNTLDLYRPLIGKLVQAMERSGRREILDLCSGGGGGWLSILKELRDRGVEDVAVRLSDRFPNLPASEYARRASGGRITHLDSPVDAVQGPWPEASIITMLFALHHFRPGDARRILGRAVESGAHILVFDAPGIGFARRVPAVAFPLFFVFAFMMHVFVALLVLALSPLVRPFRLSRILFTYLIPLIPLLIWWDATVSALRAYTVPELQQMTEGLGKSRGYSWEMGQAGGFGPRGVTYLVGYPAARP